MTNTVVARENTAGPGGAAPPAPSPRARPTLRERLAGRKRVVWGAVAAIALLLLALSLRSDPVPVEAAEVGRGPLETTVSAEGVTRVRDRYVVAAPVAGRLERVEVREGDAVEAGTVVARLDPLPLDPQSAAQARARLASARAMLAEAESRVQQSVEARRQAARTAERIRTVGEAGGLSREQVERAETEHAVSRREEEAAVARRTAAAAELEVARAALLSLEGSRAAMEIRAPVGGRVLRLHEQSERVLQAGTPLVSIGDARGLEVVVEVLSTDAVRISAGAPMRLVDWGGEGELHGTVRQVEPGAFTKVSALGVEEQRVNVVGDLRDPNPALGDGYRVEARIVVWSAPDVLKVNNGALFRFKDGWAVFAIEDGRARQRRVEVGHRGAEESEVRDGLSAGDRVVLFPSDDLVDGSRVDLR